MENTMQVLVVDAEQKRLLDISRVLQSAGYRVLGASSGSECLRTAKAKGADLILVDTALPDISGIDLARELKRDPGLARSWVVLLSADPSVAQIRARALENGADGFWLRSLPSREFLAQVEAILRQKRVQDTLRLSLDEWRNVFDAIGDAVYLVDRDHHIVNCNLALAKFLRRPPSEIIGQRCYSLIHESSRPIEGCLHQRVQETRRRETLLTAIGERWFEVAVDPVLDEDDQLVGSVHTLSDVTERKKAEEALHEKVASLSQQLQESQATLAQHLQESQASLTRAEDMLQAERTGRQQAEESLTQAQAKLERQAQNHLAVLNKSQEALQAAIARRQRVEQALRHNESRLCAAVESAADLVWEVNTTSGQVEFCYDARGKVFADPGQFRTLADLEQAMHPEDRERFRTAVQQQAQTQGPWHAGFRTVGQDSQVTYWVASGTALPEAEDGSQHWIAVASDVTARRQQEQEQRMEAVSRLAAGLAQEMEQLLAVVLGSAELGLSRAAPSSAVHSNLTAIQQTARSGADLSRRLWAVGRGLEMQPEALDLNARLVEWEQALRQHGGENVQVQFALADNLPLVRADATALEQILCILAERARRVMPDGGTLCVETAAVQIDQAYCSRQPQATPGSYGRLSVADSGMTLDEATCEHLFEPFSVDSAGQPGSELGLAMVYSLLKQLDGWVVLAPQGDAGTCFHLYFPVAAEPAEPSTDAPAPAPEEEASRSVTTQEAAAPTGEPADPTVAPEEPPPAQAVEPASNSAGSSALPEGEAVGPTAGQPAASSTDEPVGPSETQPSGSMPSDPDVAAPQLLRKVKGVLKRGRDRQHER